jgi:hypothetical protein
MTPLSKVFMLSSSTALTRDTMKAVLASGHSRVPVYRDGDRCGGGGRGGRLQSEGAVRGAGPWPRRARRERRCRAPLGPSLPPSAPSCPPSPLPPLPLPTTTSTPGPPTRPHPHPAPLPPPPPRTDLIGLIIVKELLQYKVADAVPVAHVRMRSLPR